MADVTINALSLITPVVDSIELPASTSIGSTGKVTIANINSLAPVQSVAARTGAVVLTKTDVGLSLVENKSSATIRGEISSTNVTTALGYTPYNSTNPSGFITANVTGTLTTDYISVRKQNDAGEGGEISLQGSGGNGSIAIDNFYGNCRVFSLAPGKVFQVLGGGINAEGPLTGSITTQTPCMAKAWVNFDGNGAVGNCVLNSSYNVSAVSKTSNGQYTITFSPAVLSNSNYVTMVTCRNNNDAAGIGYEASIVKNTSQVSIGTYRIDGNNFVNPTKVYVVIFGG